MTEIRYLDVCSGYSAVTVAWEGLGFRCVGYSEIEPFPRAVLEERHGAVPVDWDHRFVEGANTTPLFGDFTKIEAHHVGPVDLLTGGTPCQAFSVAGKRLGLDDPRGNLTLEFLALARRVCAPWLLWENVPGFLSHDRGRTMGTFLRLLGECGYGYAYRLLDAQFIRVDRYERAVPQRRRRLFLVAHLGDAAGPATVLFEPESLRGDPSPRREAGEGIAPTISARTKGGGGLGTDFDCDGGLIADIACTLPAGGNVTGGSRQPGMGAETAATMLVPEPQGFGGGNTSGPVPVAAALAALAAHGRRQDFEVETFVAQPVAFRTTPNHGAYVTGDRIDALTTGTDRSSHLIVPVDLRNGSVGDGVSATIGTEQSVSNGQAVAFDTTQITSPANFSNPKPGDPCHPLARGQHPPAIAYSIMPQNSGKDFKARAVDVVQPLMAGGPVGGNQGGDYVATPIYAIQERAGAENPGSGPQGKGYQPDIAFTLEARHHVQSVAADWAVRRLTPTECERLMGLPDGFTAITYRGKPAADGPRYKVCGNSQAENQMRWIGRGLADVIGIQSAALDPVK